MNDLLDGKEAGKSEALASLPKTEAWRLERTPRTFRRPSPKRPRLERAKRQKANHRFRSPYAQRMQRVSAHRSATEETTCRKPTEEQRLLKQTKLQR